MNDHTRVITCFNLGNNSARDQKYAMAYAALADSYVLQSLWGNTSSRELSNHGLLFLTILFFWNRTHLL